MTELHKNKTRLSTLFAFVLEILGPEKEFYILAAIYGIGISLLSLALPVSVQMLINTVANTALVTPLLVLSITLFILLLVSGLLNALRIHLMEIFGRRFYARITSEISLRALYAVNPFFQDAGKSSLFNRYFDMMVVQKAMPSLMIGGFTLLLQALVGFVLVSLYHPLFLVFNIVFILLIWAVMAFWGPEAIRSAVEMSHQKHETAAWLESVAASNGYFKSEKHVAHALKQTDYFTSLYVDQHRRHFRSHFSQTIALLLIYAAASAVLLGLGGWLVIQGQLTLGQLVAAELILSAVFAGVAQLGTYLTSIYDIFAAVDELSLFFQVDQETPSGEHRLTHQDSTLNFVNVRGDARGRDAVFNFTIPHGKKIMSIATDHGPQRMLSTILRRHIEPSAGFVTFGGADLVSTEVHALRNDIVIIDRPTVIEMKIRDYLQLSCETVSPQRITEVLNTVGLQDVIAGLKSGLDTEIAATGWPLSVTETIQLKVAAAILASPRVLVFNQLVDLIPEYHFKNIVASLRANPDMTVLYFSNREIDFGFDTFLLLDHQRQKLYSSLGDLKEAYRMTRAAPGTAMSTEEEDVS